METPRYTRILRERWYIIVIAAVLGVLAAVAVGRSSPPNYAATATLFLRVEAADTNLLERSQFSLARIKSYVDLVSSPSVLQKTIDDLNLDLTVDALAADVHASNPTDTVLLEVTAESSDPRASALIANSVARNLAGEIQELESSSVDDGGYAVSLDLRIPADNARSTTASQLTILIGLGLLGGLAVGAVIAALVVILDPRARTIEDIRRSSGLPVVGQLPPSLRRLRRGKPFAGDLADAFRGLVVDLRLLAGGVDPSLVVLVPTSDRDRSQGVRLGLARTMAESGMSVAVVAVDPADPLVAADEVPADEGEATSADAVDPSEDAVVAPDTESEPAAGDDDDPVEPDEVADDATDAEPDAAPARPSAVARAAASVRSVLVAGVHGLRSGLTRPVHPVPGEAFAIIVPDEVPTNARGREQSFIRLADEAAGVADTVVLIAREGEELPAVSSLGPAAVLIVVDIRRTHRTRLRSVTTALEFAGVHPAGVVMTSLPSRRRVDLPSTWFEGDRIDRPTRRAGVRTRRSGPKPAPAGGGKQPAASGKAGPAKSDPAKAGGAKTAQLTQPDPTELTLDFGEQEAIAG